MKIQGKVISGVQQAGNQFGVETANIDLSADAVSDGIYVAKTIWKGKEIPSIVFAGTAHLVKGAPWRFEVHLLDGKYSLYGEQLEVELLEKLRDVIEFTSNKQAMKQIQQDVEQANKFFE